MHGSESSASSHLGRLWVVSCFVQLINLFVPGERKFTNFCNRLDIATVFCPRRKWVGRPRLTSPLQVTNNVKCEQAFSERQKNGTRVQMELQLLFSISISDLTASRSSQFNWILRKTWKLEEFRIRHLLPEQLLSRPPWHQRGRLLPSCKNEFIQIIHPQHSLHQIFYLYEHLFVPRSTWITLHEENQVLVIHGRRDLRNETSKHMPTRKPWASHILDYFWSPHHSGHHYDW